MNERDVKDVFQRVLDTPRTPGADRVAMLSLAHRARRRRTVAWTGSAGATAVVIAAVATLAVAAHSPGAGAATEAGQVSAGASATATAAASKPAPARSDEQYAQDLLAALPTLVPPGFTFPTQDLFTDTNGTKYVLRTAQVFPPATLNGQPVPTGSVLGSMPRSVSASTDVYRDGRQASVIVHVVDSAAPADLCMVQIEHQGTENGCRVATATNGAQIRLGWRDISTYGRTWYATRYYAHRSVTVQQYPGGMNPHLSSYGAVWDEAAVVEVAANPVLAP
jgi:hypothetical protein